MKIKISTPIAIYELGKRANQEDSIFPAFGKATADDHYFVVCDGMGGHDGGDVASSTVVKTIGRYVESHRDAEVFTEKMLEEAMVQAYDALDAADTHAAKTMGTTLTFLALHDKGCMVAHIGDSRVYHIRLSEGKIWHTRDHSLVQDLFELGEIEEHEMKTHPRRNIITRVMMPNQSSRIMPTVRLIDDVRPGDWFMLCSDGVTESSDDSEFLELLSDGSLSDEDIRQKLLEMTKDNSDNHSAYLIKVVETEDALTPLSGAFDIKPRPIRKQTSVSEDLPSPEPTKSRHKLWLTLSVIAVVAAALFFLVKYLIYII